MLEGPIASGLSHPSSDCFLPELGPAFLQHPPDELVWGSPKSVVLGGALGGAFAVHQGLCRGEGMDKLACSEPPVVHALGACFGPRRGLWQVVEQKFKANNRSGERQVRSCLLRVRDKYLWLPFHSPPTLSLGLTCEKTQGDS